MSSTRLRPEGAGPRWQARALAAAMLVAVAGVFLSLYVFHHLRVPVGYDTPKYVWRARLVADRGMAALSSVPHGVSVTADRPGYPVLVDLWSAALGASPFRLAMVFPAVAAVMIAAGAAGFARACLRRPAWQAPLFGLAVGASPLVALMAGGHADSLLLSVVAVGAAVAVLLAADGRRTMVAAALLLGSGAVIHWSFAALLGVLLAALGIAVVPESLRARRAGTPWARTPAVRALGAVAGGAAVGAAALALAPASPSFPGLSRHGFLTKLHQALPDTWWPVAAPAAAVGVAAVAGDPRPSRMPSRALVFLVLWAATPVLAVAALEAGASAPAHRVLEFALALPLLAAAGVIAAAGGLARAGRARGRGGPRRAGLALGTLLVAAGAAGTVAASASAWWKTQPTIDEAELRQVRAAAAYVDGLPEGRPAILLVDTGTFRPDVDAILADHWIRLSVDTDRIATVAVYVGDYGRLLADRPTLRGQERFDRGSSRFWSGTRDLARRDPAVIALSSLDRSFPRLAAARPGSEIAPGVAVLRGPLPAGPFAAPSIPGPPSVFLLALLTLGSVGLTTAVGSGWSAALLPPRVRLPVAPALGVAVLVLGGTAADRAGVRLHGLAALGVVGALAAGGWIAIALRGSPARSRVHRGEEERQQGVAMDRGSDKHNPRVDEELEKETQAIHRGEPTESRAEEFRQQEGPGGRDDDEESEPAPPSPS
ncbi:MAG: hypothetical protein ACJ77A_03325 [Actinomycetota bacterium]